MFDFLLISQMYDPECYEDIKTLKFGNGDNRITLIITPYSIYSNINGRKSIIKDNQFKNNPLEDIIPELNNCILNYKKIKIDYPGMASIKFTPEELEECQYAYDGAFNSLNKNVCIIFLLHNLLKNNNYFSKIREKLYASGEDYNYYNFDYLKNFMKENATKDEYRNLIEIINNLQENMNYKIIPPSVSDLSKEIGCDIDSIEILENYDGILEIEEIGHYQAPIPCRINILGEDVIIYTSVYCGSPT